MIYSFLLTFYITNVILQYYDKPVITTLFVIRITNYWLPITPYNQGTKPNLRSLLITHYLWKVRKWEGGESEQRAANSEQYVQDGNLSPNLLD